MATQLTERIPLKLLHKISRLSLDDYISIANKKKYKLNDVKEHYKYIMDYVKNHIKAKGEMVKLYKHSENSNKGRLYGEHSIQNLDAIIRGFLFGSTTTDIDMKNAHPHILEYICRVRNIECPNLTNYVANRDKIITKLKAFGVEDPKMVILALMNGSKKRIDNDCDSILSNLNKEFKAIRTTFQSQEDFVEQLQQAQVYKPKNVEGSFVNRILCIYENQILQEMVNFVVERNIEVAEYAFDGMLVYGDYYDDAEFLKELTDYVNAKFENLNMVFTYKHHNNIIEDFCDLDTPLETQPYRGGECAEDIYEELKLDFEKTHSKIISKGLFITETENGFNLVSKNELINGWEHIGFGPKQTFIGRWLKDQNMRTYDNIKCIPPPMICPPRTFNTWKPFAMELITEYEKKDITPFLDHIKIICNNEEPVYDYVVKWLAQMIQFPCEKSIMLVIQSVEEGTGKGFFLKIIQKLIGNQKYLESTNPNRDVWGQFNSRMSEAFLVHISELSKKESVEAEGRLKGLITDNALQINFKGKDIIEVDSFHRFILATNDKLGGVNTHAYDRRKLMIKTSNELLGNIDYFTNLDKLIKDTNYTKSFYEYLKSIPDMNNFHKLPVPKTEYQLTLCELSVSPVEGFIKEFVSTKTDNSIKVLAKEFFSGFNHYLVENKIKYEMSSTMFGITISTLKIEGIKKVRSGIGNCYILDIPSLKKHYQLGCLIDI